MRVASSSRVAVLAALLLASAGCTSMWSREYRSIFPPSDFRLALAASVERSDSIVHQRLDVWPDGMLVFRQAESTLAGAPWSMPLYTEISAYQLHDESRRMLARRLYQVGLMDEFADGRAGTAPDVAAGTEPRGVVQIGWQMFAEHGRARSGATAPAKLERLLRIVNAFLPTGREIATAEPLTGAIEPRHVEGEPQPTTSVDDAIGFHRQLSLDREDDPQLLLDLFALAVSKRDVETGTEALRTAIAVAEDRAVVQAEPVPMYGAGIRRPVAELDSLWSLLR